MSDPVHSLAAAEPYNVGTTNNFRDLESVAVDDDWLRNKKAETTKRPDDAGITRGGGPPNTEFRVLESVDLDDDWQRAGTVRFSCHHLIFMRHNASAHTLCAFRVCSSQPHEPSPFPTGIGGPSPSLLVNLFMGGRTPMFLLQTGCLDLGLHMGIACMFVVPCPRFCVTVAYFSDRLL